MNTKTYTKAELYAFQAELESAYRIKKTVSGEKLSFIDFDAYLIDQGACVRREGDYAPAIRDLTKCLELTEKWDQLCDMLNKKAYAKAKEAEELAVMQP